MKECYGDLPKQFYRKTDKVLHFQVELRFGQKHKQEEQVF